MSESGPGRPDSSNSSCGKEFSCDICGGVLSHPSHVSRHKRLKHPEQLDHECPTCGDVFSSDRGLKLHHSRTHGESLAVDEKECLNCGESFEFKQARDPEPKFCDYECRDEWQVGENASNWRGGKVEIECEECGGTFKVLQYESDRKFCGQSCFSKWHSRNMRGEDNPSWNGGKIRYYGPNWNEQRRKARERDNHTCQSCGRHKSELGKEPSVHHITPLSDYIEDGEIDYERANRLLNLVSLCQPCHRKWEGLYLRPDPR